MSTAQQVRFLERSLRSRRRLDRAADVGRNSHILCVCTRDSSSAAVILSADQRGAMTQDYKRNGADTLFAALNIADGKAIRIRGG